MGKTIFYIGLLALLFCAIFAKQTVTPQRTIRSENFSQNTSYSTDISTSVEGSENESIFAKSVGRLSKPKCGLRFSGYVSNLTTCVTIFCNFILASRHWALMPQRCAIPSESGGVSQNLFTMGRLSDGEKYYSLSQTVRGEKIVSHPELPVVMVKLAQSFIPNDCFQSWLPVAPPQEAFFNLEVEGYKGNEPKLYIIRKKKHVSLQDQESCEYVFKGIYVHKVHFCILHSDSKDEQEFIPPGSPIYGYYKGKDGKEFHDIVGMKWRVRFFNERYFAICFRLHNYVDWINSVING